MTSPFTTISTVVTSAASYNLTTLPIIKEELNITGGGSDSRLSRYLSMASSAMSDACNRVFQVETVRDEMWPKATRYQRSHEHSIESLRLSRFPVVSVASLTQDATTLTEDVDFRLDKVEGKLLRLQSDIRLGRWNRGAYVGEFDAGFETIPPSLVDAVIRMVRNRWNAKDRDPSLVSENIPGVRDARWWIATGNEAGNMPPDIEDLIESYFVPVVV